jgi:hydrogenase/urease accessory protein HupE
MSEARRHRRFLAAVFLVLLFWPGRSEAHLVTTGLGPIYDGIGHFFESPEDIIPAVALGILAGLRGPGTGRWTLLLLPMAWILGGLVGINAAAMVVFSRPTLSFIVAVTFLLPGILVAADLRLPVAAVGAVVITLGIVHGFLDGITTVQEGVSRADGFLGLLGIALTLFVLVTLASAGVIALRQPWTRIAVRVAGSWIAASGLLLLGWAIRGVG